MKKIYLIFAAVLSSTILFGQPIITDSVNFPSAGYTVPLSIGTAPSGPGTSGANQTWDFTGLSLTTIGT